jgi:hypothetical protein
MCKYKLPVNNIYFVLPLFSLLFLFACSKESRRKLADDPANKLYVLENKYSAGIFVSEDRPLLPPPFNLVVVHSCFLADSTDNFSEAVLLAASTEPKSLTDGRLVCGMRFKHRDSQAYKTISVFIPAQGSPFKYLHQDQFRLKYDEMLRIVQSWTWNYLGYQDWSFDAWVSTNFIQDGLESCLDLKDN